MITVNQISNDHDAQDARHLIRAFTAWAFTLDADAADAPTFEGLDAEIAALPEKYAPPSGCFLLARDGATPVGCVAFLSRAEGVVEVKRMYVDPQQRGKGVGLLLIKALIAMARQQGTHRMYLDSYHTMHSAHALYRSVGFEDMSAPEDFPEELLAKVVFMELRLS